MDEMRTDVIITDANPEKVAIVGFAPNWDSAPFSDENFEIWGLNELYVYFEKKDGATADRWFEIHSRYSPTKNTEKHIGWLKQCPIPIYMQDHYDDIPSSVKYPKDEILKFISDKGLKLLLPTKEGFEEKENNYVTNSISWMFLLAWMEGFKEIHIYGVDLAAKDEYLYQRPNLEYYIGAAQASGIKVIMPETCDLLKASQLYGFETDNKMRLKMKSRIKELQGRIDTYQQEIAKAQQQRAVIDHKIREFKDNTIAIQGSIQDIEYWLKNWVV